MEVGGQKFKIRKFENELMRKYDDGTNFHLAASIF